MEQGLAAIAASGTPASMNYGDGKSNTIKHYYGGAIKTKKKKEK